jgi:hypothetical protein
MMNGSDMATVLTGNGITYMQFAAWKGGLKACKTGLRVNSAYTPNVWKLHRAKSSSAATMTP